jgi:DNA polymerase III subunit delta
MTSEEILKSLKAKQYKPVYFLMGEEPYYIDEISDYIQNNVLDEAEKEFNQSVLYGKDVDILSIISTARRFPMMAPYQVVIVKEAQNIRDIEALQSYVEKPVDSTILVICYKYKTLDKRKSFTKKVADKAVLFESKKIYADKVPGWITNYLKGKNYSINPKAAFMLAEYLGNDLSRIANELEKLSILLKPGMEISPAHVSENIGISKEFNVFELQEAIGRRDVLKSNQIVRYFAANPKDNPLVVTLSNLFSYFSKILLYHYAPDKSSRGIAEMLKISPFFVKDYEVAARNYSARKAMDIIGEIREYDLRSKGVNNASASDGELLKELLYKILH